MTFLCKQISESRWGIYNGTRLLATVSDRATCEAIMSSFKGDRHPMPADLTSLKDSLEKTVSNTSASGTFAKGAASAKTAVATESTSFAAAGQLSSTSSPASTRMNMMSDDDLARVLNVKSLKVNELESAVLQAQRRQDGQRS